ncbi:hypothetical protein J437_LFUL012573 [Ladona fulva]|uniref:Uncharacterized protein n=1 Tax=Ladona fulva TaxID=123851 RepID=A0A8K0KNC1_LADFU|nr:hypothetical protein J437_LFUL012573 [Ladona fulva]
MAVEIVHGHRKGRNVTFTQHHKGKFSKHFLRRDRRVEEFGNFHSFLIVCLESGDLLLFEKTEATSFFFWCSLLDTKSLLAEMNAEIIKQVKRDDALDSITKERWASCVMHAEQLQDQDFWKEIARDYILEPIVINLAEDSTDNDGDDECFDKNFTQIKVDGDDSPKN